MKIIHLISGGDSGGAKTHVHTLLMNLNQAPGVEVTMVTFMDGPFSEEARVLGIPTVVLPGQNLIRTYHILKKMIQEGGYEIIHCHGARGNMMGVLLRRATGLPVVTTVHSDYRLDYMGRPLPRLTYGTINTIALRLLDFRIGVSDAMVDLLISRGFDPETLFPIYNGLDFTPRPASMDRAAYWKSVGADWPEDSVVAGIAARLNPVKDIATLIRGYAKARESCPKLRLLIAGDGEQRAELQALATSLGVEKDVCFAGWVSDIDTFYQSIDIILGALENLPEGAIASPVRGVPPKGEFFTRVEQPRGEAIYYIKGNGTKNLERFRLRTPTNCNIAALVKMLQGCDLADVPNIILTIDPCISCCER